MIIGATVLASLALAAVALFSLRRRASDLALLSFTAFAALYAVRLFATTSVVRDILGGSDLVWDYVRAILTYVMPAPLLLFAEQVLGPGWRDVRRHLRRIAVVFAVVAVVGCLIAGKPDWALTANHLLVLAMLPAIAVPFFQRRDLSTVGVWVMRAGIAIAAFFVLAENLRAINWLDWPSEVEFIGFVALAISLAYSATERFLSNEGRLAAVDRELDTARRIQRSILPRDVPSIDGVRVTVRYLPMTAVAGDLYDFFLPAGGPLGLLVADVSGHGVPAALIASMVKVAASSHKQEIAEPGQFLTSMNRTLDGQLGGQFVTAICAHLDRAGGVMAYAGAGHPPILHWRASTRELVPLHSTGMILGPFPGAPYDTGRQAIAPGDRLALYTDGLLEARDAAGRMFGDDRFPDLLREHADLPGAALTDIILRELTQWTGKASAFDDDVTLMMVDIV